MRKTMLLLLSALLLLPAAAFGILTYLLVRRQMLDMKFYVPRLAVRGLYYGATLGLFLTAAAAGSALHAAGLFALFGLLTYGYRRVLLRLRKRETRSIERLKHQKLRLSLQLAEKNNIREIIKLFAELLHETIEVQGLVLVYYDDEGLTIAHGTGIYEGKWAFGSAESPDGEPPLVRSIELAHVCCSVSDNGKGFSDAADLRRSGSARSRFGLMSVCDRMEHLGGSAKIDSVPGQGTSGTLKLPLRKEGEPIP